MKRTVAVLLIGVLAAALAGCASPGARIQENPALFDSFPPDVQANVRQGKVEVGYTKDMVYIALGKPDRTYIRKTDAGVSEVWSYVDRTHTTRREQVSGQFRIRDPERGIRTVYDTVWVDVPQDEEYERLRLEFSGDKVKSIEEVKR